MALAYVRDMATIEPQRSMFDRLADAVRAYQKKPRPPMGEVSNADPYSLYGGRGTVYNPSELVSTKGYYIFDQMRRDDQVKAALAFKKQSVLAAGWHIVAPEGKDDEWEPKVEVERALYNIDGGFTRALKEVLSALDYGFCLHGDTPVHTVTGPVAIRDLVGTMPWVYSWDSAAAELRLAQASRVWLTKHAPVLRVTYEWYAGTGRGRSRKQASIIATDNHPFLMLDGTYRRAGALREGDRLQPFSETVKRVGPDRKPRAYIKTRGGYGNSCWEKRAPWVLSQIIGRPLRKGEVAHHRDGDTLNDAPLNLERKPRGQHAADHTRQWLNHASPQQLAARSAKQRTANARPEVRTARSAASTAANLRTWRDPAVRQRRIAGISKPHRGGWHHTPEARAKIAQAKREQWAEGVYGPNHRVVSIEQAGTADVYDMTVPGLNNFAASNVFVHNSVTEKIWEMQDGKARLRKLATRKPYDLMLITDKHGNLISIEQQGKALPLDKLVVYTYDYEFSNHYGRSDLEAAYRAWWTKNNAYKWMAMMLERLGIPPIFALYNSAVYTPDMQANLHKILTSLQAATVGAIPRPKPDDLQMWAPELGGQVARVFLPAMEFLNQDISRALLMPGLIGMTQDTGVGSLARSQVHFDVFMLVLEDVRQQLTEIVNEEIIDDIIAFNFGELEEDEKPRFEFMPLTDDIRLDVLSAWAGMVNTGVTSAQDSDETHIRAMLKFPEPDESDVEERATRDAELAADLREQFAPEPAPGTPGAQLTGDEEELPDEEQTEEMRQFADKHDGVWLRMADGTRACVAYADWDESKHPRRPKGDEGGGRFAPGGGGGGGAVNDMGIEREGDLVRNRKGRISIAEDATGPGFVDAIVAVRSGIGTGAGRHPWVAGGADRIMLTERMISDFARTPGASAMLGKLRQLAPEKWSPGVLNSVIVELERSVNYVRRMKREGFKNP